MDIYVFKLSVYPSFGYYYQNKIETFDRNFSGGSILIFGFHSPGGMIMVLLLNCLIADSISSLDFAK